MSDFDRPSPAIALLDAALGVQDRSGLAHLAEQVARCCGGVGCVIWYVEPTLTRPDTHRRRLGPLAFWFDGDEPAPTFCSRALAESEPGHAILDHIDHAGGRREVEPIVSWRDGSHVTTSRAVRLRVSSQHLNDAGAISLITDGAPDPAQLATLDACLELMPRVLETTLTHLRLVTLSEVGQIIGGAEPPAIFLRTEPDEDEQVRAIEELLLKVCKVLRRQLGCDEVTIRINGPQMRHRSSTWLQGSLLKTARLPSSGSGLTSWAVANGKPLHMPDLRALEDQPATVIATFPGLEFTVENYGLGDERETEVRLGQRREEAVCSFVAVPIISRGIAVGAVRASLATIPAHLLDADVELLQDVARRVASYWEIAQARLQVRIAHSEIRDLDQRSQSVFQQPANAPDPVDPLYEFITGSTEIRRVVEEVLDALQRVVPHATVNSFRVVREVEGQRMLDFAAVGGSSWPQTVDDDRPPAPDRRFDLDGGDETSVGRWVVENIEPGVRDFEDPSEPHDCAPTVPGTRFLLCAPVNVGTEVFGVLDLRSMAEAFTEDAARTLRLFAVHLALFLRAAREVDRQRLHVEAQRRMIEDLVHQIISPLRLAGLHLSQQHDVARAAEDDRAGLVPLPGAQPWWRASRLVHRAAMIAASLDLYRQLEDPGEDVVAQDASLSGSQIRTMVEQAIRDTELFTNPKAQLTYQFMSSIRPNEFITCDHRHLEQCLFQLLENARKYSWPNQVVFVRVRHGENACELEVVNRGPEIHPAELARVMRRGERGDHAVYATSEGQGIGLWIVDELTTINGGQLQVRPAAEVTTVVMRFPWRRRSDNS